MAEPTLGEGLALQSNWAPDTSKVITAGTGKMLDMSLKKEIAKQKAEEAAAKEKLLIASKYGLKAPKISMHNLEDAQNVASQYTQSSISKAYAGDLIGAQEELFKGQTELAAIEQRDKQMLNFINSSEKGFLIPEDLKAGFQMRKKEGQEYLNKLIAEKPEYSEIFQRDEYGNYTYSPVKNIDLTEDYKDIINNNASQFALMSYKNVGGSQIKEYKIQDARIDALSKEMAKDRNYVVNALLKDKQGVNEQISLVSKSNPSLTKDEAAEIGFQNYFKNKLQSANQDFSSNQLKTSGGGAGQKSKLTEKDFSPSELNVNQVSSILELAEPDRFDASKVDKSVVDRNKSFFSKTKFPTVVMPNVSDVFSFTDSAGREFNAPIGNITAYKDKLYISGSAKNIPASGANINMQGLTLQSASEFTPDLWKALKVYYAKQRITGDELARYINNNLEASKSTLRINPNTGTTYSINSKKGSSTPTPKLNQPKGGGKIITPPNPMK